MRAAIPQFTTVVAPLTSLLEQVYQKAVKRTKRAVAKVALNEIGWESEHTKAFADAKTAIGNSVTLSHPDPTKIKCLFTDASELHWSGILTQIPPDDLDLPFHEQRHFPLAFISGSFRGSKYRWSTPEKEAAAIIYSVERLDYLLMGPQGFHLYTDHSNLVFIYNPERSHTNSETLFCLNRKTCEGKRHFMRDCPATSKE